MDENRKFVLEAQVERTMKALAKNQKIGRASCRERV